MRCTVCNREFFRPGFECETCSGGLRRAVEERATTKQITILAITAILLSGCAVTHKPCHQPGRFETRCPNGTIHRWYHCAPTPQQEAKVCRRGYIA